MSGEKTRRRSRQVMEINVYKMLIQSLLVIITNAGIKLPPEVMQIVDTLFPVRSEINAIKEFRCGYCRLSKTCVTGQYRFQEGGCGDRFRKKLWLFWKRV